MVSFSLQCTTCKARLRIRDGAALGQILPCPKCGSMVLVQAPEMPASGETEPAAAVAAEFPSSSRLVTPKDPPTTPTFDDVGQLISGSGAPQAAATPTEPLKVAPSAAAAAPALATQPVAAAAFAPAVASAAVESVPPAPALPANPLPVVASAVPAPLTVPPLSVSPAALLGAEGPVFGTEPPVQQPAPKARALANSTPPRVPLRTWPTLAAAGGALVSGSAMVLWVAWSGLQSGGPAAVRPPVAATMLAATTEQPEDGASPSAKPATEAAEPPPEVQGVATAENHEKKLPADGGRPDPSDLDFSPPAAPASPEPAAPAVAAQEPAPLQRTDPAANLDPAPAPGPAVPPGFAFEAKPDKPLAASDGLGQFSDLINPAPSIAKDPGGEAPAVPLPPAVEAAVPSRDPPRQVDVAARLADPLVSVEISEMPLADFLRLMGDMSTIPFTVDPASLHMARATAETRVSVKLANTTVGQAMQTALQPLQLVVVPTAGGQARIERPPPAGGLLRRVQHDLTDLAAGDTELPVRLEKLVPLWFAPHSWQAQGGPGKIAAAEGKLTVEHEAAVQLQVLVLAEKIRAARRLPYKSKLSPELFSLQPAAKAAHSKLAATVTVTWLQPTRLTDVLASLEQASGARLLVDWQALAAENWGPASETTLVAPGEPLQAVLDSFLPGRGLAYRVIDASTLQITSAAANARQSELRLYNLGSQAATAAAGADLLEKARRATGKTHELFFDAASRHLVTWLTPAEQATLEQWLRETLPE